MAQRLVIEAQRLLALSGLMEEKAAGAESLRIIGAQFQRRVIGGDGFLELALPPEFETLVIEGCRGGLCLRG